MLAVVYLEAVLLALLSLGFLVLNSIGISASISPAWYTAVFLIVGTYSLASLWWILVTVILLLQRNRRYAIPLLAKIGIGTGFVFALFIVFYPWLFQSKGYVVNPFPVGILFFVSIPCGITLHLISLMREV